MTVEELIEALTAMPATSRVEVDVRFDSEFDETTGVDVIGAKYEFGTTTISVDYHDTDN